LKITSFSANENSTSSLFAKQAPQNNIDAGVKKLLTFSENLQSSKPFGGPRHLGVGEKRNGYILQLSSL
jgi:hypothetical protein